MTTDIVKAGRAPSRPDIGEGDRGLTGRLWAARRWLQRRAVRELDTLSDAALKNVGLRRVDAALAALNAPGYLRPDRYL